MPDPVLEVEGNFELQGGISAGEQLRELNEAPTAIFSFNDNMAIGALQTARARAVRIPEDLSIVGFDDLEEAAIVTPGLTTVRQPPAERGRIAVRLLIPLLDNQSPAARHV